MTPTPQEIFLENTTKFKDLIERVRQLNAKVVQSGRTLIGHDIDHDLMVAQIGALVSETEREAEMTFVCGICHSRDRHHGEYAQLVIDTLLSSVSHWFSLKELETCHEAIRRHSEFANKKTDSPVLKALKDGDKLANCGPVNLFRCAQHNIGKPAFILEEMSLEGPTQGSTFKDPRSCFDALFFNEEWRARLQMPKAIAMGHKYFDYLQQHQRDIVAQLVEVGLYPFPR